MATMALLFAALLSIPLGVLSASRKVAWRIGHLPVRHHLYVSAKLLDRLYAPARLRSLYFYFFSIMGADSLKDFILPALALAIPMAAGNIRVFRSSLLDGYNSDFVLVMPEHGAYRSGRSPIW